MAEVDPDLRKALREHPQTKVDLILHVDGSVPERQQALAAREIEIKRGFRLTHTISVRCTGQAALKLLRLSWVTRVEPDGPIKALRRSSQ